MLFEFKIVKNEISKISSSRVRSKDVFNKCKFYFDEDTYKDRELFVTFISKHGAYQHVRLGQWDNVLSCIIPSKFLKDSYFKIVAYPKDGSKTNTISVFKNESDKVKYIDEIDYLLKQLDKKIDNIEYEDNQLKCYSGKILLDTVSIDNIDIELFKEQIEAYFSNLKEQFEQEHDKNIYEMNASVETVKETPNEQETTSGLVTGDNYILITISTTNNDSATDLIIPINDIFDLQKADEQTLTLNGHTYSIKDKGITSAQIADETISAEKIASSLSDTWLTSTDVDDTIEDYITAITAKLNE